MKLIYIEWHDAFCNTGWCTTDEIKKTIESNETWIKEVGWLLKETKTQIIIAARWSLEDACSNEQFGLIQKIPKTWIRKRIDLTKHIK